MNDKSNVQQAWADQGEVLVDLATVYANALTTEERAAIPAPVIKYSGLRAVVDELQKRFGLPSKAKIGEIAKDDDTA